MPRVDCITQLMTQRLKALSLCSLWGNSALVKLITFWLRVLFWQLEVQNNEVVAGTGPKEDWSKEFQENAEPETSSHEDWAQEFQENPEGVYQGAEDSMPWDSELADEDNSAWAGEFNQEEAAHVHDPLNSELDGVNTYRFAQTDSNPFVSHKDPFAKGLDLYQTGRIPEAILAFEAELIRNPSKYEPILYILTSTSAKSWQMIGLAQAENDNDTQATAALIKANELEHGNMDTLLALAVSCTNDFNKDMAVDSLHQWIRSHPKCDSTHL